MDEEIVNKKSILQRIIDTIARFLSIKQKKDQKKEKYKDDIYPMW
tara:strand:+ start:34 stop:168 length:135 start_codon:yes stop_codon:yes gene_type:complete